MSCENRARVCLGLLVACLAFAVRPAEAALCSTAPCVYETVVQSETTDPGTSCFEVLGSSCGSPPTGATSCLLADCSPCCRECTPVTCVTFRATCAPVSGGGTCNEGSGGGVPNVGCDTCVGPWQGDESDCDGLDTDFDGIADDGCAPAGETSGSQVNSGSGGFAQPQREDGAGCSDLIGDPVTARTGDLVLGPYTDFVIRGQFDDDPIRLDRLYHSAYPRVVRASSEPLASLRDSFLGMGWYHSFATRLEFRGSLTDLANHVVFIREDGRGIHFVRRTDGTGIYDVESGRHTALEARGSGTGGFVVREVDDTRYEVGDDGRVLHRLRPSGHGVHFSYETAADGTRRRLICVTNDSGQAVTFVHAGAEAGQIWLGATCGDLGQQLVDLQYRFNIPTRLREPMLLSQVSYPGAGSWSFTSDGGPAHDRITEVRYGAPGAGILMERIEWHLGTTRVFQTITPSASFQFDYAASTRTTCPDGTLVTDLASDAEKTTCIRFDAQGRAIDNSGVCRCGDLNGRYGYSDPTGGIEIRFVADRNGTVTTFAYDERGNLVARVANDGDDPLHDAFTTSDPVNRPRALFFYGDPVHCPHSVTEIRRASVLRGDLDCDGTNSAGCQRTLFTLDCACNVVRVEERGYTFADLSDATSADADAYCRATDRCYLADGRISQEVGPYDVACAADPPATTCDGAVVPSTCAGSPDEGTKFVYWPAADPADPFRSNRLHQVLRFPRLGTTSLSESFESYDRFGYVTESRDANGTSTVIGYQPGRPGLVSSRSTAGETTTITYDLAERIDLIERPVHNTIDYVYSVDPQDLSGFERLSSLVRSNGETRTMGYALAAPAPAAYADGNVRLEKTFAADGTTLLGQRRLDYLQHHLSAVHHGDNPVGWPAGTERERVRTTSYDPATGLAVTETLENGTTIRRCFDRLGRLRAQSQCAVGSAAVACPPEAPAGSLCSGPTTRYEYDVHGDVSLVTTARSLVTRYLHDDAGGLLRLEGPNAAAVNNVFNARGLLAETRQSGVDRFFGHDDLGRLCCEGFASTARVCGDATACDIAAYTYDEGTNGQGRLTSVVEAARTTTFAYESSGRLSAETRQESIGGTRRSFSTGYTYSANGDLASIEYPVTGATIGFTVPAGGDPDRPDAITRSTAVGTRTLVSNLSYFPFESSIRDATFGGAVTLGRQRLLDGRWTDVVAQAGTTKLVGRHVRYDDVNLTRAQTRTEDTLFQADGSTATWRFGLDAMRRVNSTAFPVLADPRRFVGLPANVTYSYDDDGNRDHQRVQMPDGSSLDLQFCYTDGTDRLRGIGDPPLGGSPVGSSRRGPSLRGAWEQILAALRQRLAEHPAPSLAELLDEFQRRLVDLGVRYVFDPRRLTDRLFADPEVRGALFALLEHVAGASPEPLDHRGTHLAIRLLAAMANFDVVAAVEGAFGPDPPCDLVADQFFYDSKGSVIEGPVPGFCRQYDALGRAVAFGVLAPTVTADRCAAPANWLVATRWQYDWRGRRVVKQDLLVPSETHFFYDQQDRLIAQATVGGTTLVPEREYVYHGGEPVMLLQVGTGGVSCSAAGAQGAGWLFLAAAAMLVVVRRRRLGATATVVAVLFLGCPPQPLAEPTVHYYVNDGLGTPLRMIQVDASGAARVSWSAEATAFGEMFTPATPQPSQPLRFPGQYDDSLQLADNPVYYNWHRYYVPGWGRYLETEPVTIIRESLRAEPTPTLVRVEKAGTLSVAFRRLGLTAPINLHAYVYAQANPLQFTDPVGLYPVCVPCAQTGAPVCWEVGASPAASCDEVREIALAICGPDPSQDGFSLPECPCYLRLVTRVCSGRRTCLP